MQALNITPGELPPECEALRAEVREFIAENLGDYPVSKRVRNWSGNDPEFSRKMAERGWIGMT
ncbi:MAG: acyl-CoA dehydrogenase family protein, partial [Burkholderiaceae bacterium]|nr:acyl-CoA dehydrogenase family protein [Burkholderiaceae bacterium]